MHLSSFDSVWVNSQFTKDWYLEFSAKWLDMLHGNHLESLDRKSVV